MSSDHAAKFSRSLLDTTTSSPPYCPGSYKSSELSLGKPPKVLSTTIFNEGYSTPARHYGEQSAGSIGETSPYRLLSQHKGHRLHTQDSLKHSSSVTASQATSQYCRHGKLQRRPRSRVHSSNAQRKRTMSVSKLLRSVPTWKHDLLTVLDIASYHRTTCHHEPLPGRGVPLLEAFNAANS
jgi:hypothetical protein